MAAVTFHVLDLFRVNQNNGGAIDFEDPGTIVKTAIVTAGYTPDQNTHEFFSDVGANEVSGTGYTAGGNVMSNGVVSVDGAGLMTIDIDDPAAYAQDGAGFSNARRSIVYVDTGSAATSPIIGFSDDYGADQGNVAGVFQSAVNAAGLIIGAR